MNKTYNAISCHPGNGANHKVPKKQKGYSKKMLP